MQNLLRSKQRKESYMHIKLLENMWSLKKSNFFKSGAEMFQKGIKNDRKWRTNLHFRSFFGTDVHKGFDKNAGTVQSYSLKTHIF